jgi:hypothetical protein
LVRLPLVAGDNDRSGLLLSVRLLSVKAVSGAATGMTSLVVAEYCATTPPDLNRSLDDDTPLANDYDWLEGISISLYWLMKRMYLCV